MEKAINQWHSVAEKWIADDFFAPDTVVVGLDIGIEGLGIAVRRGREMIYCQTLLMDLPKARALAARRQRRAARHARKNYRCRMRRLKALFEKHGLPWVADDICHRSDPYELRYRAMKGTLASKEALSLCIRSCVALRGYDFFALSRGAGGEFPWGESNKLTDAKKWVQTEYVNEELAEYLLTCAPELTTKGRALKEEEEKDWKQTVRLSVERARERGIPAMLEQYRHSRRGESPARGHSFPRSHVEEHMRFIIERHQHLIDNCSEFVESLFLPCRTKEQKEKAIFHYNRKTPEEAQKHYESKVKDCPYCSWSALEIEQERCGVNGDVDIQLWKLVDFLSARRFDMVRGGAPSERRLMPEAGVKKLVAAIQERASSWRSVRSNLEQSVKPLKFSSGDWNKSQMETLKRLVVPGARERNSRANLSRAAAKKLFRLATEEGGVFDPALWEQWKKDIGLYEFRARIAGGDGGIYPQTQRLLGRLRKKRGGVPCFAVEGWLQRVFRENQDKLGGKTVPDYCVIECVKNPSANADQRKAREDEIKKNEKRREQLTARYGLSSCNRATLLRLRLFEEQGGYRDVCHPEKNKSACCPFTGEELKDPFDPHIELAHIYPDSRGGLYMAENLALTMRETNKVMGNRTPAEAAQAQLKGWLPWDEMLKVVSRFHWSRAKRELFAFIPRDGVSFPNFNNMTRTAQLAAELRRLAAVWMGISADAAAISKRIGNPSGIYTAAARSSMLWPDYKKDRSNNIHHRYDAAVMTCIPPLGVNDVRYGGIFQTTLVQGNRRLCCIEGLPLPDFSRLKEDGDRPPVVKSRGSKKTAPLGDATFWSVGEGGKVRQRISLTSTVPVGDIEAALSLGDGKRQIASAKIAAWKRETQPATEDDRNKLDKPLKMNNGFPVKHLLKKSAKGDLSKSPLGWSGILTRSGSFFNLRKLSECNARMELWLGWDGIKKSWMYYKRLIPTREALRGLARMGMPWRGRKGAPDFLIELLDREQKADLKALVCGTLPPHAVKVGAIRKGDVFGCEFTKAESKGKEKAVPTSIAFSADETLWGWGAVSAIRSDGRISVSCLTHKNRKERTFRKTEDLSGFLKLPSAAEKAAQLGLEPPL